MTEIVPVTLRQARAYVAAHHRHNEPPITHRFSIGLERDGVLVGVVIAGSPVARMANDGRTIELSRLTTEGDRNACSRLYGAACRAAAAMGYKKVITYTLAEEPGTSLRASGFTEDGTSAGGEWTRPSRYRAGSESLWGELKKPTGPKVRWVRHLTTTAEPAKIAGAIDRRPNGELRLTGSAAAVDTSPSGAGTHRVFR